VDKTADASVRRCLESNTYQLGMQFEVIVRNADSIEDRIHITRCDRGILRVREIGHAVLNRRLVGSEISLQAVLGTPDDPKWHSRLRKLSRQRFADGTRGAKDRREHLSLHSVTLGPLRRCLPPSHLDCANLRKMSGRIQQETSKSDRCLLSRLSDAS
jgi:hypothetical protein